MLAHFVCVHMYVDAEIVSGAPGSGPVFLQDVSCSPTDDRILDCDRYVSMDESSEGRGGVIGVSFPPLRCSLF